MTVKFHRLWHVREKEKKSRYNCYEGWMSELALDDGNVQVQSEGQDLYRGRGTIHDRNSLWWIYWNHHTLAEASERLVKLLRVVMNGIETEVERHALGACGNSTL